MFSGLFLCNSDDYYSERYLRFIKWGGSRLVSGRPVGRFDMNTMTSSNGTIFRVLQGIHRSPVNSPHKGQWHGALMFSFIYVWINSWVNNREAGDLWRYRARYDVIVMKTWHVILIIWEFPLWRQGDHKITLYPEWELLSCVDDTFVIHSPHATEIARS